MDLHPDLLRDLGSLTDTLGDPSVDLTDLAVEVVTDLQHATRTLTSVTLTVAVDGLRFDVTATDPTEADVLVETSVRLQLTDRRHSYTTAHLVLCSDRAGSLASFAADARAQFGIDAVEVDHHLGGALDEHPTERARSLSISGEINQAVGVLINGGRTQKESRDELSRLASGTSTPVVDVARRILRDAVAWHPPRFEI